MRAAAASLTCSCFPRRPPDVLQEVVFVCGGRVCRSSSSSSFALFTHQVRWLSEASYTAGGSKRRSRGPVMAAKKMAEGGEVQGGRYKETVDLPSTTFSMKANSVVREPEIQRMWEQKQVFKKVSDRNVGEAFNLHDGPPYANGEVHMGHALNKILKDFINRFQLLQGRKVRYVPGWDCHGLPIELKVLQSLDGEARKALTPLKLRKKAAQFAMKAVEEQRKAFKRFGVWADWDNPYLTLNPDYEAAQIGVFGKMLLNGHIYRGFKPVHWSPSSRTALAEAELEYPDQHTSLSIYALFKLTHLPQQFPQDLHPLLPQLALAIWTTTPWTIPANAAVAVNDQLSYTVVEIKELVAAVAEEEKNKKQKTKKMGSGLVNPDVRYVVVAQDLVEALEAKWGVRLEVKGSSFLGKALENSRYMHPLQERESPVVVGGDYVTTEAGTGLVHTAPGHGQDDYVTGMKYGLPLLSPVDGEGKFTEEAGEAFHGMEVLGEGNVAVVKALDDSKSLVMQEAYVHKYPYDWRTRKPTIVRATEQWFASVEGLREAAMAAVGRVEWVPPQGERRMAAMTGGRADWCISRQRSWGVPIPVFYRVRDGQPLLTPESIAKVQAVVAEKGSDAWWYMSTQDLLPEEMQAEAEEYVKGGDTMDVWFDSGCSWAGVKGLSWPAQVYLEGSDQHRGWFQSSLLTSVAATGAAPYKSVLTHGFVLDEKGCKMSKSLGNVVDPRSVVEGEGGVGADVLRLWVASVDYTGDVAMSSQAVKQMGGVYRKLRGTLRYLLANLHDWTGDEMAVEYGDLPEVDRFALSQLGAAVEGAGECFRKYQFFRFFQLLQQYVVVDLSSWYFDGAKDRLYVGGKGSWTRRCCQTVLAAQLLALLRIMAPVLPHLAEDAWQNLPFPRPADTVFEGGWPRVDPRWREVDAGVWTELTRVREQANRVMELARDGKVIGANLDAKVGIWCPYLQEQLGKMAALPAHHPDSLHRFLLTSQAEVLTMESAPAGANDAAASFLFSAQPSADLWIGVARADGDKCERCWNYSTSVSTFSPHPTLCSRCHGVVTSLDTQQQPAAVAALT